MEWSRCSKTLQFVIFGPTFPSCQHLKMPRLSGVYIAETTFYNSLLSFGMLFKRNGQDRLKPGGCSRQLSPLFFLLARILLIAEVTCWFAGGMF